jgi:diguanylate cyclase (GGDEF)-like protein
MTFISNWYQLILCALLCPSIYALLAIRRRWTAPERELITILPSIHRGEVPIDDLLNIQGPFQPLAQSIHGILRDLRQQQAAVARLEMEIQQRISNKTDALQRTIGSLRLQASKDAVTGLYNRRMLDQILPEVADRVRAAGSYLTLLMIDLDYFKSVNDTLGHAAGDQLLIVISQIIRSGIRDVDMAFRYGGDEFVILMPEIDHSGASTLAQHLSDLVSGHAKTLHLPHPPALSVGIACTKDLENSSATNLLRHADEELYKIKSVRHAYDRRGAA